MYDDRDPFPKKIYKKSTIIIWLVVIVVLSVGVKIFVGSVQAKVPGSDTVTAGKVPG